MTETEDCSLHRENTPDVCAYLRKKMKKLCSVDAIFSLFPVIGWLPKYKWNFLLQDFVAGLTVGLTAIPQAIAYGTIAGLPPQYGLYSAFMGCFVYFLFGTCKDITVGPTAIMAMMIQTKIQAGNPDYAILCCFLTGCIITLMGVLNLGALLNFISVPVTTGFTMAAAMTIGSGQINNLFGINSSSNDFFSSWRDFFTHITDISLYDTLLGVITVTALLLLRKIRDISCRCRTFSKYASLSRNILAVIVGILLCYFISKEDWTPFKISGQITPGLPPFQLPPFSTVLNGSKISFGEMVSHLGTSLVSIPMVSVLESIAVAKAFSRGKIIDASQEMIALGVCNIAASFVSSMPITGSFTRTAINNSSGVVTPFGGIFTGILVLLALAFLTNAFYYLPKSTLAAIIITAMIFMVEYEKIAQIWRAKKTDMIPLVSTVIVCLIWSLEYGLICGIILNLGFILHRNARPNIRIVKENVITNRSLAVVTIQGNLNYACAEYLKAKVLKFIVNNDDVDCVVIKGENISSIDYTVALNTIFLKEDLSLLHCEMICWNWCGNAVGVVARLERNAEIFKFGQHIQSIGNGMQQITD